jgi:transcriptional regulator with XRE-family HTH domain
MRKLIQNLLNMLPHASSPSEMITAKIRTLRRNREYSQEYMALVLHISQNAYSRLENGKTPITIDRLYEVCQILEVKPSDLLDRDIAEISRQKTLYLSVGT